MGTLWFKLGLILAHFFSIFDSIVYRIANRRFHKMNRVNSKSKPENASQFGNIQIDLAEELKSYQNFTEFRLKSRIYADEYLTWKKRIRGAIEKEENLGELEAYKCYIQLFKRNYEATLAIPGKIIEFLLALILGAFIGAGFLCKIEASLIFLTASIAVIAVIEVLAILFSSASKRPLDFSDDLIELVEERIQEVKKQ